MMVSSSPRMLQALKEWNTGTGSSAGKMGKMIETVEENMRRDRTDWRTTSPWEAKKREIVIAARIIEQLHKGMLQRGGLVLMFGNMA